MLKGLIFLIGLVFVVGCSFILYKTVGYELTVLWILVNIYWEIAYKNIIEDSDDKKTN